MGTPLKVLQRLRNKRVVIKDGKTKEMGEAPEMYVS
jgi:hypothetical protein